jgi:hypothetical protein
MLLEDESIQKVGNRVHCEVKSLLAWDINVRGVIELGHLAYDRALTNRAPSLGFLVELLWPGVVLEGKDGSGPRVGDWDNLDPAKILYAATDSYTTMMVFLRLMQFMKPKEQPKLLVADVEEGIPVTLYTRGWKHRVADAVLVGVSNTVGLTRHVRVKLDLQSKEKIYAPGTFVEVIQGDNEPNGRETISSLCLESQNIIVFDWPLHFCRRTINVESGESIQINTEQRQRRVEIPDAASQSTDADEDLLLNIQHNSSDSSVGDQDNTPRLPRSLRCRLNRFKVCYLSLALIALKYIIYTLTSYLFNVLKIYLRGTG